MTYERPVERFERPLRDDPPAPRLSWPLVKWALVIGLMLAIEVYIIWRLVR